MHKLRHSAPGRKSTGGEKYLNKFIKDNKRFIMVSAFKATKRFISESDDEWSIALILGSGGLYSYNNVVACSYVSLDSTPSIEYTLNRKNLVLDVTALNEEATEIVQELKDAGVKKSTLSEAMEMTAGLLEKYGYLDTDATDYVLINESSVSDRKNAKSLGISSGEYQEIQRIKENETADSKPKISADDIDKYGGLGVRELLENSGQLEKKEELAQPSRRNTTNSV